MKINNYEFMKYCALIFLLALVSCGQKNSIKNKELSLDPRYLQIEDINSLANCRGPNGYYTTKVVSKKDGSLFFTQIFSYKDAPFMAEIKSDKKGYVTDEKKNILDTLSIPAIVMIRTHDFHRLQTNPGSFFSQIKFVERLDAGIEIFSAIDQLNNPVKIYYDTSIRQLRRIEFQNMMDTTEGIEVVYKQWDESEFGKLAKEIEIIQAKKDTFNFDFETIKIN